MFVHVLQYTTLSVFYAKHIKKSFNTIKYNNNNNKDVVANFEKVVNHSYVTSKSS